MFSNYVQHIFPVGAKKILGAGFTSPGNGPGSD